LAKRLAKLLDNILAQLLTKTFGVVFKNANCRKKTIEKCINSKKGFS
jgi:hypothetical protein